MNSSHALFGFVQFEFGFLLGPGDGRFLVRPAAGRDPEHVLVLTTLGASQRHRLRGRKGRTVEEAQPEPVPTNRATVIRAAAFGDQAEAAAWLEDVREGPDRADAELATALVVLARALRAHRVARADPSARDVSPAQALVTRIGYGAGEAVADGRYAQAWELPREHRRTQRSMEAPDERFAALLGAREQVLVCEELVLRVRADLIAGRDREAALGARVALEAVLAELARNLDADRRGGLEADRRTVGDAANTALRGALSPELESELGQAVVRMEAALRARRLESAG